MKRIPETSASADGAAPVLIRGAALPPSGVVDPHRAARASNDAHPDVPVRAIDALAACMASSTFAG